MQVAVDSWRGSESPVMNVLFQEAFQQANYAQAHMPEALAGLSAGDTEDDVEAGAEETGLVPR